MNPEQSYPCCVCVYVCVLSLVKLFAIPWTVAHQTPLSMEFSKQEYWIGLPCSPPGDLLNPGVKPAFLMSPALAGVFFTTALPGKPWLYKLVNVNGAALVMHLATFDLTRDSLTLSKANTFL